jgi:hypothetical protein
MGLGDLYLYPNIYNKKTMETVTENQVLTQEELQVLNLIQEETQALIYELGEIELIKLQLDERKNQSKNMLDELRVKEQTFNQDIITKYGKVNINTNTGEIIPLV